MSMIKAKEVAVGMKVLVYGAAGSGKSTFAATFPSIAAIDSENGLQFYIKGVNVKDKKYNNIKLIDRTSSLDDYRNDLIACLNGAKEFEGIQTLLIDSETKFYNQMQNASLEVEERRARKNQTDVDDAAISQRSWGKIKLNTSLDQQLKLDLSAKGIHIVSTAQNADLRDKLDATKIIGDKPDTHKSAPYDYDIVLHFSTTRNAKDGSTMYRAQVVKDRTGAYKKGDIIENPTFDNWAESVNSFSKAEKVLTSFSKSLEQDITNMQQQQAEQEDVANGILSNIKMLNAVNRAKVQTIMKEMGITSFKNIDTQATKEDLQKLLVAIQDFIKQQG